MIQRINLIEKQALALTYQTLLRICMGVIALNLLLVGVQWGKAARLRPKITAAQTRLDELNVENTELTKQPAKKRKKVTIGEYQQLFDTLNSLPNWSKLLKTIGTNMPNSLWLMTFKSAGGNVVQAPVKSGKDDKDAGESAETLPPPDPFVKIELAGRANDLRSVAEFVSRLGKEKSFSQLTLVNSAKDAEGYTFTIQGQVTVEGR